MSRDRSQAHASHHSMLPIRRPSGISESTQWLFLWLTIASLLLSLPASLSFARGQVLVMALTAALVLTASWIYGYARGRVPLWLDALDAVAIGALALASPNAESVIALTFASIWYRALFGSTWRSVLRCGLYVAAIATTIPLWLSIPGHHSIDAAPIVSVFPLMFLTVLVGRQLASGLLARQENLQRSTVLAVVGPQLLGATDPNRIRALGWTAMTEICAATPHMAIIEAMRRGSSLSVVATTPGLQGLPDTLALDVLEQPSPSQLRLPQLPKTMVWSAFLAPYDGRDRRVLVGAPKLVSQDALMTLQALVSQLTLAFSNLGVYQDLTMQASVDSLTGLANRASFNAELLVAVTSPASQSETQVLFIDLDDFKDVNDIMGHQAGDEVLAEVANRLRTCSRAQDLCARLGGDEFAILLPRTSAPEAEMVAERVVARIAEPISIGGAREARVGASIGITSTGEYTDIKQVIHEADVAMYAAKAQGKGRVQYFDASLLLIDEPQAAFDEQLSGALDAGEIVVHYQPILNTYDGTCIALEALARWRHPTLGLLEPHDFLGNSEKLGCDVELGEFVLRRACADAAAFQLLEPTLRIAIHVNVSGNVLARIDFFDLVAASLAESGLAANQLVLELTESVAHNSPFVVRKLKAVVELGVRIAINEFGTGYSSLSCLRSLPVTVIKLDAAFIDGALANAIDRAAIEAIVHMSHQLGLQTIAEGIERVEQHELVRTLGIDGEQGYLHLRPMPAANLSDWLHKNLARVPPATVTKIGSRVTA